MLLPVVFEADFPVLLARLQIMVGLVVWLLDDGQSGSNPLGWKTRFP